MSELRKQTGQALGWDLFGNYGGQIISFGISILLARLLEPEEFGLVGMSMVFIAVLRIFMDLGFASALVQAKETSSLTYSSVFYLNILAGFILTLLLYFTAPLIGDFYNEKQVESLVRLLSIVFFISAFNIVQSTILKRTLNFKVLTIRTLASQSIAGIIAVFFAWRGYGVYALVIQQIVASLITTVLLWKITDWYPKFEFSYKEVKNLTSFSLYVLAAQSVGQLIKQADTLIIGKLFSASTLGFYSRANSLNNLISTNSVSSISKVFFPALSKIQDEEKRFVSAYLKTIEIVAGIAIFLTGIFFLSGEEIIIGLFGKKWQPSVLIFQILIIRGFTYPISAMVVNAFMAKGKSQENFHYGNIRKILRLSSFAVAYYYGFYPFIYSLVCISLLNWVLNNYFIAKELNISFIRQLNAVIPQLLYGSIIAGAISIIFPKELHYGLAILEVILFSLLYFTITKILKPNILKEVKYFIKTIWLKLNQF